MKTCSYIKEVKDIELLSHCHIDEVILAPKELSRKGQLSLEKVEAAIAKAREKNIRIVLEWDILINENEFDDQIKILKSYLNLGFKFVRVQDPGALEYILEKTSLQVQWITEHGNHNSLGLGSWCEYIGKRLDRLIISNELSFEKLKTYQSQLDIDLEILILGKILLFYTPRSLLAPVFQDHDDESKKEIHALADSEESPHKGFHIVENRHGTFMYHLKDLCLINESEKLNDLSLRSSGKLWGRFEVTFHSDLSLLEQAVLTLRKFDEIKWSDFKKSYPVGLTKGFFLTNKTNVLFPKLKNYRLLRSDNSYIGEVVDVVKGEYLVFHQKSRVNTLEVGIDLESTSPEGKTTQFQIQEIHSLAGDSIDQVEQGKMYMLNYRKGITPRTVFNLKASSVSK